MLNAYQLKALFLSGVSLTCSLWLATLTFHLSYSRNKPDSSQKCQTNLKSALRQTSCLLTKQLACGLRTLTHNDVPNQHAYTCVTELHTCETNAVIWTEMGKMTHQCVILAHIFRFSTCVTHYPCVKMTHLFLQYVCLPFRQLAVRVL